jgi:hypothetical protein
MLVCKMILAVQQEPDTAAAVRRHGWVDVPSLVYFALFPTTGTLFSWMQDEEHILQDEEHILLN